MSTSPKKRLKQTTKSPTSIPPPFSPAPSKLTPFLETLDPRKIYITHIDTHPAWFKRRIFTVPVLLNLGILSLLIWRALAILPWYIALLRGVLAPTNSTAGLDGRDTWGAFIWLIVKRAVVFLIDYLLITIVWPWPISFFFEQPGNPVVWRWNIGFQDREAVVRQSRNWGSEELLGGSKKGGESPFFKTRLLPAVEKDRIIGKTGYLLMDKDFDLDFKGMVDAHKLLSQDKLSLRDIHMRVFMHAGDESDGQWLVWDVEGTADEDLGSEGTEEGKKKILEFRDRLTAMGKEELFFKWVELVQEETSKPGGFTKERQFEAGLKVQALFEEYGLSFEEFAREVGIAESGSG
jgi:hypothetical protein